MSSGPKTIQTPFEKKNAYGFESQDANNPYVKAFMDTPTGVDPGVGRRTDLAEQDASNRWNSSFASGLPVNVRMQMQAAEQRQLHSQGAAEAQQAEYQKNQQEMSKRAMLLPQLVQTGQSGYDSQVKPGGGLLNTIVGGAIQGGTMLAIA